MSFARLGGFIGRKSGGEPGWQTIYKGYARLQDMLWGANLFVTCGQGSGLKLGFKS